MTRDPRPHPRARFRAFAAALLLCALAASCTNDEPAADPDPTGSSSGTTSASPSPSTSQSEEPDAPEPGSLDTPASTSGPLSQQDFPTPKRLGAGWDFSVDPGDPEEGYSGNGTPALARNPREVVQLAVPFGCARRAKMPAPAHALEVDYTAGGTKVVSIRGEFSDREVATSFFEARSDNVRRCVGRSGGQALGTIVGRARMIADDVLLSDRTPESDPWAELAVLDGDQVVLVAAQTKIGTPPMTTHQARRLARHFRR